MLFSFKPAETDKQFQPASGGLFGGKPVGEEKKPEAPTLFGGAKPAGSLFGGPDGKPVTSLFGGSQDAKSTTSLFGGPKPAGSSLFGAATTAGSLFGATASTSVFQSSTLFSAPKKDDDDESGDEEEEQGEKSPPTYADPDKVEFKQTFGQAI